MINDEKKLSKLLIKKFNLNVNTLNLYYSSELDHVLDKILILIISLDRMLETLINLNVSEKLFNTCKDMIDYSTFGDYEEKLKNIDYFKFKKECLLKNIIK